MIGQLVYLKDVATLKHNVDLCKGCGRCTEVCPHAVMQVSNGKAQVVDRDLCMECGACAKNCPAQAVTVQAGVGCAAAVIAGKVGKKEAACCYIEDVDASETCAAESGDTAQSLAKKPATDPASPSCGPGCC
jgi:NAD-dependent dihydropyrimidine dehydrogenase PreA subunit